MWNAVWHYAYISVKESEAMWFQPPRSEVQCWWGIVPAKHANCHRIAATFRWQTCVSLSPTPTGRTSAGLNRNSCSADLIGHQGMASEKCQPLWWQGVIKVSILMHLSSCETVQSSFWVVCTENSIFMKMYLNDGPISSALFLVIFSD